MNVKDQETNLDSNVDEKALKVRVDIADRDIDRLASALRARSPRRAAESPLLDALGRAPRTAEPPVESPPPPPGEPSPEQP